LQHPIERVMLGGTAPSGSLTILGVGLVLTAAATLQTAFVNAEHRVGDLARITAASAALGSGAGLVVVRVGGLAASSVAVIMAPLMTWAVSRYQASRTRARWEHHDERRPPAQDVARARSAVVRMGLPVTGSMLVGGGLQYVFPAVVLHELGVPAVGLFRAAQMLAFGYVGVLLNAMGQDYMPRLSALPVGSPTVGAVVDQQLRFVMLVGGPLIAVGILAPGLLLRAAFSSAFASADVLLSWFFVGTLFRLASWVYSYAILSRGDARMYFGLELAGGIVGLVCWWTGMHLYGLVGLGIGCAVSYAAYFALAWRLARGIVGRGTPAAVASLCGALVLVLAAFGIRAWVR
jgi:PST family polysaccharide transporter